MWSSISTYFDTVTSFSTLGLAAPNTSSFIYRDELNKKPSPLKKKLTKKGDCRKDKREPLLVPLKEEGYCDNKSSISCSVNDHEDEQKGVIRVKVKMTKQEAVRLMSKCKEGGVIGFKDVANELVKIPARRMKVVSNSSTGSCGVLETIPEEEMSYQK